MTKTALDLSPKEWQAYHPSKFLDRQRWEENPEVEKRWQEAQRVAQEAARILREEFEANEVILFGSLTERAWFTPWSDIDLAARGIPGNRYFEAVATVTALSAEINVDLVDIEFCPRALRVEIERTGIEI